MIKVACPSCQAPYELDERRLPPTGLKMRCPKCGTSFMVNPPGADTPKDELDLPALSPPSKQKTMLGAGPAAPPPPPRKAPLAPAFPSPAAPPASPARPVPDLDTELPMPAPRGAKPAPPISKATPVASAADSESWADFDLDGGADLPAPSPPKPRGAPVPPSRPLAPPKSATAETKPSMPRSDAGGLSPTPPKAPPPSEADFSDLDDLPAPRAAAKPAMPKAPAPDADLPAVRPPVRKPPLAPPVDLGQPASTAVRGTPADIGDFDLPAPKATKGGPFDLPAPLKAAKGSALDEFDLPAPKVAKTTGGFDELDLPAPKAARGAGLGDVDLPAPTVSKSTQGGLGELDLPAPKAPKGAGGLGDLDLPAPKVAKPTKGGLGDLDLPAPKAPRGAEISDFDLPAPKAPRAAAISDFDLPAPKAAGRMPDLDLPAPKPRTGGALGDLDLPAPRRAGGALDDLDLPARKYDVDLPAPKYEVDLPAPRTGGALDIDLPVLRGSAGEASFGDLDLPMPRGDIDLPAPRSDLPQVKRGPGGHDLDLPMPKADFDLPVPRGDVPDARAKDGRRGAGGTGFGEVDLGGGGAETSDASGADDMEFGDIPQESGPPPAAPAGGPIATTTETRAKKEKTKEKAKPDAGKKPARGRGLAVFAGVLGLIVAVGVGLGFTPYGFFGMYAIEPFLPGAGDPAQTRAAIAAAEQTAQSDTYVDVRRSLVQLGTARHAAGLDRGLLARSVVHECLYAVRFGEDAQTITRVSRIFSRLDERGGDAPGIALARAADALRTGDAQRALSLAGSVADSDPYAGLVKGEAALKLGQKDVALAAFQSALGHAGGARAQWGVARATLLGDDAAASMREVDATLAASPGHTGARIAKARLLRAAGELTQAEQLLSEATGLVAVGTERLRASQGERAEALVILGRIQETRGNARAARESFEAALAIDGGRVDALLGSGRVLLAQQRYTEALARFQAVVESGAAAMNAPAGERPPLADAKLGGAQALLALERPQEARTVLEQLVQELPQDYDVLITLGRVEESLEDRAAAEQHYREAVQHGATHMDGYLALARLFYAAERAQDAAQVLAQAEAQVPESAEKRRLLGLEQLDRNELGPASESFTRALALDANDDAARFGLGSVSRRLGRFPQAEEAFEALAARVADYPGLALERGLLYEAQGRSGDAVGAYTHALEERPDDPDLLLRLGAAQVSADQIDAAEETLRRVRELRPNSAEAEHFMGRVAFARGDPVEAGNHFDRALLLDASRGEFHLYAGWAALEQGDLAKAMSQVEKAIELDPSLGDAFWVRGEVRLRAGQVRTALDDLNHALELKPGRYAAFAAMGECYDQLRQRGEAIQAYELAVAADPENGRWHYRLGRLRLDAGDRAASSQALARAVELGDALASRPAWVAEAHRLYGDTLRLGGQRADAVVQYRKYLELAPETAIDREEIEGLVAGLTR